MCVLDYVRSKKRNKVSGRKNIIEATAEINEIQKLSRSETKSKVSPLKRLVIEHTSSMISNESEGRVEKWN